MGEGPLVGFANGMYASPPPPPPIFSLILWAAPLKIHFLWRAPSQIPPAPLSPLPPRHPIKNERSPITMNTLNAPVFASA